MEGRSYKRFLVRGKLMNELTVQKPFYTVIENILSLQEYENYYYPRK